MEKAIRRVAHRKIVASRQNIDTMGKLALKNHRITANTPNTTPSHLSTDILLESRSRCPPHVHLPIEQRDHDQGARDIDNIRPQLIGIVRPGE